MWGPGSWTIGGGGGRYGGGGGGRGGGGGGGGYTPPSGGPGDSPGPGPDRPAYSGPAAAPSAPDKPKSPRPTAGSHAVNPNLPMPRGIGPISPVLLGEDPDAWSRWWRFNREQYFTVSEDILRPESPRGDDVEAQPERFSPIVFERIVPALYAVLDEDPGGALRSAVLLTLARIGEEAGDELGPSRLHDLLVADLASPDRALAETACIGLGILGRPTSLTTLSSLLHDTREGRELVGRAEVSLHMRAFAAYGIGLSAQRTENSDVRRYATHTLVEALPDTDTAAPDHRVASVIALGMIDGSDRAGEADACPCTSNEALSARLLELFENERDEDVVRAHVPTTLARLTPHVAAETKTEIVSRLAKTLKKRSEDDAVRQGCTLALGLVGDADDDPVDQAIRAALTKTVAEGDRGTKGLALVALAQVAGRSGTGEPYAGTADVQRFLTKRMVRAKSHERKWIGLALGVMGRSLRDANAPNLRNQVDALRGALKESRSPDEVAAFSIGSGLCRDGETIDPLIAKLERLNDAARGHAALGLGLSGSRDARDALHAILPQARHDTRTLEDAAIALSMLEDPELISRLTALLEECDCLLSRRSVAIALGRTRDHEAAEPLLALLEERSATDIQRAWAAFGLAFLAEKEEHPWVARISTDVNYRANPASLTSGSRTGVLDLP